MQKETRQAVLTNMGRFSSPELQSFKISTLYMLVLLMSAFIKEQNNHASEMPEKYGSINNATFLFTPNLNIYVVIYQQKMQTIL